MKTDTTDAMSRFRADVRRFFAERWPDRRSEAFVWGRGPDEVALFPEQTSEEEAATIESAKAWRTEIFDNGYGWITGPSAYGGSELTIDHERVFHEVAAEFETPDQTVFSLGLGMVSPTILAHGSAVAKDRYLRSLRSGRRIACQLFSEPEAGSDLAALRTTAHRDGSGWRLDGQKVWTSRAHVADIGLCLARTGERSERHRGLTCFIVDMSAPGVEVRPLRQMTGASVFNEVYLDGVFVDDDDRVGAVGGGWTAAITTLMNERARIGSGDGGVAELDLDRVRELVRQQNRDSDPIIRQRIANLITLDRLATLTADRINQSSSNPGPELSIAKILRTRVVSETGRFSSDVLGPALIADTGRWGTYAWNQIVLGAPGLHLGGGTDEILRNVLAERVLGLPR